MKKLEDVEGQERQKALFECDVSDPEAEVKWFRGFRDDKVRSRSLVTLVAMVILSCVVCRFDIDDCCGFHIVKSLPYF